ncbi:toll/interleukin-1 receptor domain-containing protein [Spirochaeta cellobiosiphila]|uniref:toll/interleukin-1 receptor domain-containing protein n=1 Tax=Spirochaeta cellobiosiphila TaxID=504483 RepID=UPI000411D262|nr:toll/interleukin-1 receptor domain-containing protein [Spirochaeta cellobiosiphila]
MIVYRKNKIPYLYSELGYLRHHENSFIVFCDCIDDIDMIHDMQAIIRGDKCLSEIEGPSYLYIAADIPDEVLSLSGNSNKVIEWKLYFLKVYDVTTLIDEVYPSEAKRISDLDLSADRLNKLFDNRTCIPFLNEVQKFYDYGDYKGVSISKEILEKIEKLENRILAGKKLIGLKQIPKEPSITLTKNHSELKVFISYSWSNENYADELDILFNTKDIILQRDKRDIKYKDSIKEFMGKIRIADYCLILISDYYLKSKNCMYEILEFIKDEDYINKILPIITNDAKIFNAIDRAEYIRFWQDKYNELNTSKEKISALNQSDIIEEMKFVENIQRNISEFLKIISDLQLIKLGNDVTLENFKTIYNIINPENKNIKLQNGYFLMNIPRSINEHYFTWMKSEYKGYRRDIRKAKIYSYSKIKEDFIDSDYPQWKIKNS